MKPKVIVICGPTATGKTDFAINLAKKFNGEIINADSMQVYRYMDIGTAKPTNYEQQKIKHHLIDIINPDEDYDACQYAKIGRQIIYNLNERLINPFVVGGTGLYIKALLYGLFSLEVFNPEIRNRLKNEAKEFGSDFIYNKLILCDPKACEKIHQNDIFRIVRALEIFEATGKTLSQYHSEHQFKEEPFDVLKIGLYIDRETLYKRIDNRVDKMIEIGFINEVEKLLNIGYSENIKSMQSIGYDHITRYIKGKLSYDEMILTLKRDTRRYAKRQFTWFNADKKIHWISSENIKKAKNILDNFINIK